MLPPPFYLLGGLVLQFDPQSRRLGDMVAGTLVVREHLEPARNSVAGAAWASRVERGYSRQLITLPRGTLSAQQLALVEQYMARRHQLAGDRRDALAWQLTKPLLPLMGEDEQMLAAAPDRTRQCEELLRGMLEAVKTSSAHPMRGTGGQVRKGALF
jgi:hypothetical protein